MARYNPGNPPVDAAAMAVFLRSELFKIAQAMDTENRVLMLEKLHVEPTKYREGWIVLADGTDWNPGSGAGFYGYRDGAWRFIA